jgi:hypothetical protein
LTTSVSSANTVADIVGEVAASSHRNSSAPLRAWHGRAGFEEICGTVLGTEIAEDSKDQWDERNNTERFIADLLKDVGTEMRDFPGQKERPR